MAVSHRCQTDETARSNQGDRTEEPASGPGRWTRRATVVALGTLFGAGCLGTPSAPAESDGSTVVVDAADSAVETPTDTTATSTDTTTTPVDATATPPVDSPKVADVLVGLVRADDRAAYAAEHDLDYRDGRVRVVVELTAGTGPPAVVPLDVVARSGDAVEAYVDPADIPELAAAEDVRVVRPPRLSAPSSQDLS